MTPPHPVAPTWLEETLARARAQEGRCHRCAFLRQEHRPDMGHRIEDRMAVSPSEVIAIAERLAEADTVVRDYPRVMAERDAARQRIAALEAAVPDRLREALTDIAAFARSNYPEWWTEMVTSMVSDALAVKGGRDA